MKALSILLFAIVAVPAMALDMTAWKGETVNAFLPRFCRTARMSQKRGTALW